MLNIFSYLAGFPKQYESIKVALNHVIINSIEHLNLQRIFDLKIFSKFYESSVIHNYALVLDYKDRCTKQKKLAGQ